MLPDPKTRVAETEHAPQNGDLLSEITQKTIDLADTLGTRWGIPDKKAVRSFARSFISSKTEFGWEVVHQFMTVCSELELNPARKEVAAFYDPNKGLTSFVMIDGWLTLANRHPDYDGYKLHENRNEKQELVSVRCEIFRRGRGHPTEATVKMSEWRIGGSPQWMSKPEWMLNMKALKQGIRLAFGFAGIVDDDEAMAMHREPEPKQEPKGAQLADLKAASAPPADEHDRKRPDAPKATVPAPKPALKLEDAKPPTFTTDVEVVADVEVVEGPTPPLGNELPKQDAGTPQVTAPNSPTKAAEPPKEEPKYTVTDPDFNTPVICGRKGQDYIRRAPADMNAEELKYALAFNCKSLASAKKQETIDKLKKIESFLVEVAQVRGLSAEDIGLEAAEEPAPEPAPAKAPTPPKPKEVTKENAKKIGDWIKSRRMALRKAMGICAKECDLTAMILQHVEAGNVEVMGQVSDFSIEQLAETLREPEDTARLDVLRDLFGRE